MNQNSNNVSAISTAAAAVVAAPSVASIPMNMTFDSWNGDVYVASYNYNPTVNSVAVINGATHALLTTLTSSELNYPRYAAFDSANGCVYIVEQNTPAVTPLCGTSFKSNIGLSAMPWFILFDPANGYLYVLGAGSSGVTVINGATNSVVKTLALPGTGIDQTAVYDPTDGLIYVMDADIGVSVVKTSTNIVVANLSLGNSGPFALAYDAGDGDVYAAESFGPAVAVLRASSYTLLSTLSLAYSQPSGATYDPVNGNVYVPCEGGAVAVINSANQVSYVTSSLSGPFSATFDPSNGYVYVQDTSGTNVTVINGTSVENDINVGKGPSSGLYDPASGAVDILVAYPSGSGFAGYVATLGTLGPVPTAGSIGYPSVGVTHGFQQAVVSWTDPNEASSSFQWGTSRTYGLPVPQLSGTSVNLNALNAGTLYFFKITDTEANGTKYWETGSFRTVDAPTNEFVGWVFGMTSNPHELDQIGSPVASGAVVSIDALCQLVYYPQPDKWVSPGWVNFTSVSNTSGGYTLSFPSTNSSTPGYTYTLTSNDTCRTKYASVTLYYANSHYLLIANENGYWNATDWVNSTLSATNDYHQFGLLPNSYSEAALSVAFVHTNYANCNVSVLSGGSQTIYQSFGGSGFEDIQTYGATTGAIGLPGTTADVFETYHTTGIINETAGVTSSDVDMYAYGPPYSPSTNDESFTDSYSSSAPVGANPFWIGPGGGVKGWNSSGSYDSTSGLDMEVGVDLGWDGVSLDVAVPLTYETTVQTSTSQQFVCHFDGPPAGSGEYYEYDYLLNGTRAANLYAVDVHLWYAAICSQPTPTCT